MILAERLNTAIPAVNDAVSFGIKGSLFPCAKKGYAMKSRLFSRICSPASLVFGLGCAILITSCVFDSNTRTNTEGTVSIAGTVEGDGGAGNFEGAVVTAYNLSADGSLGSAVAQTNVDAQGSFQFKTDLQGPLEWIVLCRQAGQEWEARFEGTLESGDTATVRPLNLESSIESEVYLELKKTPAGREVKPAEINLAIDGKVAAASRAEFHGSEEAKAGLIAHLSHAIQAGSQARAAYLAQASAQYTANRDSVDQALIEAETRFDLALQAAHGSANQIQEAEKTYAQAVASAYIHAGAQGTAYARSSEAAFTATVNASSELSDSVRLAVARNCAKTLAVASDLALQTQFQIVGATETQTGALGEAGAKFYADVEASASVSSCDSALNNYRAEAQAAFDSSFVEIAAKTEQVDSALQSISATLTAEVQSETQAEAVGEAYADAHAEAQAQVETVLQTQTTSNATQASAAADVTAFLAVKPHL